MSINLNTLWRAKSPIPVLRVLFILYSDLEIAMFEYIYHIGRERHSYIVASEDKAPSLVWQYLDKIHLCLQIFL